MMTYDTFHHADGILWCLIGRCGFDSAIRNELGIAMSSDEHTHWIVASAWQDLAGFASIRIHGQTAELRHLYVFPAYRGRGIGDQLLQRRLELVTGRLDLAAVVTTLPPERVAEYEALGFSEISRRGRYIRMEKSL